MLHPILFRSINLLTAISMILNPILGAIPPEAVRAAPAEAAEVTPQAVAPAEPLTATVPPAQRATLTKPASLSASQDAFEGTETLYVQTWQTVSTVQNTQPGRLYSITVSGTYIFNNTANPPWVGDGVYHTGDDWATYDYVTWFGGYGFCDSWGKIARQPFNPDHVYTYVLPGTGSPFSFSIGDDYPFDNSGGLTVEIAEVGSSSVPEPAVNGAPGSDCPCENTAPSTQGGSPRSINTRTGNETFSLTDISLPVPSGSLSLTRSYSTFNARDIAALQLGGGSLGVGWTHNYEVQLLFATDPSGETGKVVMQTGGGSRVGFIEFRDGQYTPEASLCGTLTRTGSPGSYTYTYTNSQDAEYLFDNEGRLSELKDGRGHSLKLGYTSGGQLDFIAAGVDAGEPVGRYLEFSYTDGRLTGVTDSTGRGISYGYTGDNLTAFTDVRGKVWHYQYTDARYPNFITRRVDPLGQTIVRYAYDDEGRATDEWNGDDADSLIVHLTFNTDGTTTLTHGANGVGGNETHAYDARNTLTGQSNSAGGTSTGYDYHFRPESVSDANGNDTTLVWSADGTDLTSVTDALGNPTGFQYDAAGNLKSVDRADGTHTTFTYQPNTNLLTQQLESGPGFYLATNYTYTTTADAPQPPNLVKRVQAPDGVTTCYTYNEFGQPTEVIQDCYGEALSTTYEYDTLGRLVDTLDPTDRVTHNVYLDGDELADEVITNYDGSDLSDPSNYYVDELYNLSTRTFRDALGRTVATVSNYHPGNIPGGSPVGMDFDGGGNDATLQLSTQAPEYNQVSLTRYDASGRAYETITRYWPGQPDYYLNTYNIRSRTFFDGAGRVVATVSNYHPGSIAGGTPVVMDFGEDVTLQLSVEAPEFNQISRTLYDSAGRVSKTISAAWPGQPDYYLDTYNIVSVTEYDAAGNVLRTITNYDESVSGPFAFQLDLEPDPEGEKETTLRVNPDIPDRNIITCTEYDALNRPAFTTSACVPGQANYLPVGDNLYNVVTASYYDVMGRQIASVRNFEDNGVDPSDDVLELTATRNFITRTYYNRLGKAEYTVENFVGEIADPTLPVYNPATPDRNLVTRTYYDYKGRQVAVVRNYRDPSRDDNLLTLEDILNGDRDSLAGDAEEDTDLNLVTVTVYDASGRVERTIENFVGYMYGSSFSPLDFDPAYLDRNLVTLYTYDNAGRRYETTVERGSETRTSHADFDELGRTEKAIANHENGVFDPDIPDEDVTTHYAYQALGRISQTTDPEGRLRRSVSDLLDENANVGEWRRSVSITDPDGLALTSSSVSNAAGQTTRSIDASGRVTATRYDALGRAVETVADPSGLALTTSTTYDLLGQVITSTDSEGTVTRYQYDNLGRLRVVYENYVPNLPDSTWPGCQYDIDGINVCTRYAYDQAGNLASTVLGNGSGTVYEYDTRGQVTREIVDPGDEEHENITTAYEYDAAGNQVMLIRDPGGDEEQVTLTTYDRLGRTLRVDYKGDDLDAGDDLAVAYSYDAWGNRATMVDTGGRWSYIYDAMNHLMSVTSPRGIEVAYEYDATGNRTDLNTPGMLVTYDYDGAGRLDTVSNPFDAGDGEYTVGDYTYDGAGRLLEAVLPNHSTMTNTYDQAGRLEDIVSGLTTGGPGTVSLSTFHYELDGRGNRKDAAETLKAPFSSMLLSPANGSATADFTPTFDWADVPGAGQYQLQVDDTLDFTSPVVDVEPMVSTYIPEEAVAAGAYFWRVRSRDASGAWSPYSETWMLLVSDQVTAAPVLVSPADGSTTGDPTPLFDWEDVSEAAGYRLQIDDTPDFSSPELNVEAAVSSYAPDVALAAGVSYWRVRARDAGGMWGSYSQTWMLAVVYPIPGIPALAAPADGSASRGLTPAFDWSDVADASSYTLQVDDNANFSSPELDVTASESSYTPDTDLEYGTYSWRVRTRDTLGSLGDWSTPWTLVLDSTAPLPPPDVVSPADGSTLIDTTPTLDWTDVADAHYYNVQVDDNADFSSPAVNDWPSASNYTVTTALPEGDDGPIVYYWRLRTRGVDVEFGPFSPIWTLVIDVPDPLPAPEIVSPPNGSTTSDTTPTFDWTDVAGTSYYHLQVDDNADFSSPAVQIWPTPSSFTVSTALPYSTYYWRLRTRAAGAEWGPYSPTWTLVIASPATATPSLTTSPTPTVTQLPTTSPTETQLPTATVSPTVSQSASPMPTGTLTPTVTPTATTSPTTSPTPSPTPTGPAPLPPPEVVSPPNGSTTSDTTPSFDWTDVAGASYYHLQVDDNADFSSPVVQIWPTPSSFTVSTALAEGTYYWRLRTRGAGVAWGPYSPTWTLVIDVPAPLAPPDLVSPPNGSTTSDTTPSFDWTDVAGAHYYNVQVDDNADFSSLVVNDWPSASNYTVTTALADSTYYWRVRTRGVNADWGPYSPTWTLVVDSPSPLLARKSPVSRGGILNKLVISAPQELSAPAQLGPAGTDNTNPIYRWEAVAGVTSYQLVVTDSSAQTVIDRTYAADDVCQGGVCQTQSAPLAEGAYSWSVKGDITPPSAAMSFTTVASTVSNSWHYEYDKLSRVILACSSGWDDVAKTCGGDKFLYGYDGAGNLLRFDKWNATTNQVETVRYAINEANQIACIDADGSGECDGSETPWVYDAYGNLKSDGTNTYVYDAANRLSSITTASGTTTYAYNGDGDRISQSVNGTFTTYVLDTATPLTMVLSESTGGITTRYWHGLDTLAQSDGTTTEYFGYDGLGSVRQLVGESGSVGLAQTFDPYGNGFSKAGVAASSLGYSGEQVDSNGFVFLRARYYNPAHGRFFQMDPSRQERNLFQYAGSDPILYTDPSGLAFPCKAWWCNLGTLFGSIGNTSTWTPAVTPEQALLALLALLGIYACSQVQLPDVDVPDIEAPPIPLPYYNTRVIENIWEMPVEWQAPKLEPKPTEPPPPVPVCIPGSNPLCPDDDDEGYDLAFGLDDHLWSFATSFVKPTYAFLEWPDELVTAEDGRTLMLARRSIFVAHFHGIMQTYFAKVKGGKLKFNLYDMTGGYSTHLGDQDFSLTVWELQEISRVYPTKVDYYLFDSKTGSKKLLPFLEAQPLIMQILAENGE